MIIETRYDIGQKVIISEVQTIAVIESIEYSFGDRIMYKLIYWLNGERKETWVLQQEIEVAP